MIIENINIENLIPYEMNPRVNNHVVKHLAKSIEEFGFNNPIVIDENNVIINGHTRLKALKSLGFIEAPCTRVKDLSEDKKKAYRLADNKIAELAEWNNDLLFKELQGIEMDMASFGFEEMIAQMDDMPDLVDDTGSIETDADSDRYYGDARENTFNAYNLHAYNPYKAVGEWDMPMLEKTTYIPEKLQGFNYVLNQGDRSSGVHFYLDDYQFERIWNRPKFYIEKLKEFDCVLTPDFSLYIDMPMAMKIWNIYRSRLIGQMMQEEGIKVIPTMSWAEPETFEFCFDGIAEGSVVSVSTIGVKRNEWAYNIWKSGMDEMIKRIKPKAILVYGGKIDYNYSDGIEVKYFDNQVTKNWKKGKENDREEIN